MAGVRRFVLAIVIPYVINARVRSDSQRNLQVGAPYHWLVDKTGIVVEVDGAFDVFLIGHIAAEYGNFPAAILAPIAAT